jgi:hypothetical protein
MQPGIRQLHLGLHPRNTGNVKTRRQPDAIASSAVLPIPASPRTSRAALSPARALYSSRRNWSRSEALPRKTADGRACCDWSRLALRSRASWHRPRSDSGSL